MLHDIINQLLSTAKDLVDEANAEATTRQSKCAAEKDQAYRNGFRAAILCFPYSVYLDAVRRHAKETGQVCPQAVHVAAAREKGMSPQACVAEYSPTDNPF
jgi:hypothetical protein